MRARHKSERAGAHMASEARAHVCMIRCDKARHHEGKEAKHTDLIVHINFSSNFRCTLADNILLDWPT